MESVQIILALETSGRAGSVALAEFCPTPTPCGPMTCEMELLDESSGSAKTLAPAIHRLLSRCQVLPNELTAIALTTGPGSFTGLRVGIATAKAMSYALKVPLIEFDTLDIIAAQIKDEFPEIHVVLDAYRGQLFHAAYRLEDSSDRIYKKIHATQIIDIEELIQRLVVECNPCICGPGCDRIRKHTVDSGFSPAVDDAMSSWNWRDGPIARPLANTIAIMSWSKLLRGEFTDAYAIAPRYYRGSAAEEKLRQKN